MSILYSGVYSITTLFYFLSYFSIGYREIFHIGSCVPMTRLIFLLFENILTFVTTTCAKFILCIPVPALKSFISPRNPISFHWRMELETKI